MLLKTLIATLCVIGVAMANTSPVFLWGVNSPATPALRTIAQAEFAELMATHLKDNMVVVFQEENLVTKDFLCSNAETSQSCYAKLQGVSPKTYYASVENPAEALRSIATEREFNTVGKSGQLETALDCAVGKVVFVNFENAASERGAALEEHDAAISAITSKISCPAVYLYTSAPSSTTPKRVRRSTAATVGGTYYRHDAQLLMFYTKFLTQIGQQPLTETTLGAPTIVNATNNANEFSVTMASGDGTQLKFVITLTGGYFIMSGVTYGGTAYRTTLVEAPTDFSYFCGNLTLPNSQGNGDYLQFNSFQFQAPFGYTTDPNFVFGDAWHCVGFFSPGILMGLFVVIIMLVIFFVGVCWMMDINTMDRFDDPKGKTITINANE